VTITWKAPCKSNGDIEYFQLGFKGTRDQFATVEFQRKVELDLGNPQGRISYTETEMQPQYDYTVQVAVKNRNVERLSGSVVGTWQSPAGCK